MTKIKRFSLKEMEDSKIFSIDSVHFSIFSNKYSFIMHKYYAGMGWLYFGWSKEVGRNTALKFAKLHNFENEFREFDNNYRG